MKETANKKKCIHKLCILRCGNLVLFCKVLKQKNKYILNAQDAILSIHNVLNV